MKRVVILCQTAPGEKRRLAEEALRLAAGLSATGRFQLDFMLQHGGLLLLEPEFYGSPSSWDSLLSPHTRIYLPLGTGRSVPGLSLHTLPMGDLDRFIHGADLVLRF